MSASDLKRLAFVFRKNKKNKTKINESLVTKSSLETHRQAVNWVVLKHARRNNSLLRN